MSRKPDTPCSVCGRLLYVGPNSRPEPTCRLCRRARWGQAFICAVCGCDFERLRPKRPPRVCSLICAGVFGAQSQHPAGRVGRTCEICGATYRPTYGRQRTCGRACGAELNARHKRQRPKSRPKSRPAPAPSSRVWFPQCEQCGSVFAALSRRTRICGDDCRKARRAEYERHPRVCGCGTPVVGRRQKCATCAEATRRQRKRRAKRRRRALKLGVATDPYTLVEIATRDRNTCGLCRKRVAMTQAVPHPRSPTIDHILPLSKGGDDTRANVQLAHFICNSRKCDRGSQQLALVG